MLTKSQNKVKASKISRKCRNKPKINLETEPKQIEIVFLILTDWLSAILLFIVRIFGCFYCAVGYWLEKMRERNVHTLGERKFCHFKKMHKSII